MNKPYPSKISPTPIVSAAIEIKFNISCPIDAVFGMIYSVVKDKYPLYEVLPIANISFVNVASKKVTQVDEKIDKEIDNYLATYQPVEREVVDIWVA